MHQDAADGVVSYGSVPILTGYCLASDADCCDIVALERKLRRIVKHENRAARRGEAFTRRLKVPGQNVCFADSLVVEKSIRRFGVGPVLAHEWNALTRARGQLLKQRSKSLRQPLILKRTFGKLAIDPLARRFRVGDRTPAALANSLVRRAAPCVALTRKRCISD